MAEPEEVEREPRDEELPDSPAEDSPVGAPAWVVSFADMSLLLLSFFILLLAVSSQRAATDDDILKVLASIKVGFGYTPKEDSTDDLDLAVLQILATRKRGPLKSKLEYSSPAISGKVLRDRDDWVRVKGAIGRPIVFAPNSTEVPVLWSSFLDEVAAIVRFHYRTVVIQGHCSPEETGLDESGGHELSYGRAMAVRNSLVSRGVEPQRIRVVSCASHDTATEMASRIQRRAVVTLGTYYIPGGDQKYGLLPTSLDRESDDPGDDAPAEEGGE